MYHIINFSETFDARACSGATLSNRTKLVVDVGIVCDVSLREKGKMNSIWQEQRLEIQRDLRISIVEMTGVINISLGFYFE